MAVGLALQRTIASLTRGGVYGKQQRVQLLWLSVRPYVLRDFVHACLCKGVGFCILPPSLFPHARGGVRKTTTRSGVVVLRTPLCQKD